MKIDELSQSAGVMMRLVMMWLRRSFMPVRCSMRAQHLVRVFLLVVFPVKAVARVDGGNQHIEPGLPGRSDVRIGDTGVSDIDRHVIGNPALALDVGDVLPVVVGEDDVVVRFVFVELVHAEIEHEGGAGKLAAAHLFLGFVVVAEQAGGGVAIVRVDHDGVGLDALAVFQLRSGEVAAAA